MFLYLAMLIVVSHFIWPIGQAVKTPPSQGGIMGSIPVWVTKTIKLRVLTVTTNSGDTLYLYLTL